MKCISCTPCLWSKLLLLGVLGVLLVSYFGGCRLIGGESCPISGTSRSDAPQIGSSVGDIAPDFELPTVEGPSLSSKTLQGKPTVLVFWTAWCPICKDEAPAINRLAAEFEPKGVKVIGINIGESDARIAEGIKDFGIKYTVAKDRDTIVARSFKVVGTPTIIILDRAGLVEYYGHEVPDDYATRLGRLIEG